jgi:hypoxanthine phosphoribosyltransferase
LETFRTYEPASIAVAALFVKPDSLKVEVQIDYIGFNIENKFIVGYGLDYNSQGRNLPDVYQLAY